MLNDFVIRMWIVGDAIAISCFFMIIVTTKLILNDCTTVNQLSDFIDDDHKDQKPTVPLTECLSDPTGIS